jgi:hypothetical protein
VVPGSHKGPVHSLFDGERFTGAVAADTEAELLAQSIPCYGPAGSVCLMHTKLAARLGGQCRGRPRGLRKQFFFEKKNQKTFYPFAPAPRERRVQTDKVFLLLFVHKKKILISG